MKVPESALAAAVDHRSSPKSEDVLVCYREMTEVSEFIANSNSNAVAGLGVFEDTSPDVKVHRRDRCGPRYLAFCISIVCVSQTTSICITLLRMLTLTHQTG